MKVTINGDVYDTSLDWTFREEREVTRLTDITRGQFWQKFVEGSALPTVAAAIVGHMRAKPGEPCDFLLDLKPGEDVSLDMEMDAEGNPPTAPAKKTKKSRASS